MNVGTIVLNCLCLSLVRSCKLITLIKCFKSLKSLGSPFDVQKNIKRSCLYVLCSTVSGQQPQAGQLKSIITNSEKWTPFGIQENNYIYSAYIIRSNLLCVWVSQCTNVGIMKKCEGGSKCPECGDIIWFRQGSEIP